MSRRRFDLNGKWERWIRGQKWDTVEVPSSLRPSGTYILQRDIHLPAVASGERLFLHFEGVTYYASVKANGRELGEFTSYIPADLEMTNVAKAGDNRIEVQIWDLEAGTNERARGAAIVGINPGWESYGGIIREVWVETRPAAFIDNVRTAYELNADYSEANCTFRTYLSAAAVTSCEIQVELFRGANLVASATASPSVPAGLSEHDIPLKVERPLLWSPEHPHLYRVVVTLQTAAGPDTFEFRTGFRHLKIEGRKFIWNGKNVVLQGFCRHDMWEEKGFTLTSDQRRRDMLAIKQTGANYVRLAHYPHHREIIDLADELGLFVTEEPGYWQVNFSKLPENAIAAGLDVMEGAIRRDWNAPSMFAWFLGNESTLTVDFLKRGRALCDRLDPIGRPVSFANDRRASIVRPMFEEAGMDFFSHHLYTFNSNKFDETAEIYGDGKPLVIDEWGWEDSGHGQVFWERNFDHMLAAVRSGKVSGHSFWSWNDMRQYARIDWPTFEILYSGVVTESRQPKPNLYERFIRLFQDIEEHPGSSRIGLRVPARTAPDVTPLRSSIVCTRAGAQSVDLQAVVDSSDPAWESLENHMAKAWDGQRMSKTQWERTGKRLLFWSVPEMEISGLPFRFAIKDGYARPIVVTPEHPNVTVPVNRQCNGLYLLGNVTFLSGFPFQGKYGDVAAVLEKRYAGGRVERMELRNGIEVAQSNTIHVATRIEPIATAAPRALLFQKDPAREQYQILLLPCPANGRLTELRLQLKSGPPLAIFAITSTSANERGRA